MSNLHYHDILSFVFDRGVETDDQKPIYVDGEDPNYALTALETQQLTRCIISSLKEQGLQKGDRVVVHLPNSVAVPPIIFAIIGVGAVYVGSNPLYKAGELEHLLSLARPQMIITCWPLLQTVLSAAKTVDIHPSHVRIVDAKALVRPDLEASAAVEPQGGQANDVNPLERGTQPSDWLRIIDPKVARTTPAVMFTTSGTTGLPKLAVLSHASITANVEAVHQVLPYQSVRLTVLPFFLFYGFVCACVPALRWRTTHYTLPRFQPKQYLDAIQKYSITDILTAPVMLGAMLRSGMPLSEKLRSVRFVSVGGSQLNSKLAQAFRVCLSAEDARIFQCWGMTETGLITVSRWADKEPIETVGPVAKGTEVMLVDETSNEVPDGQCGEAWVRGPGMFDGYISRGESKLSLNKNEWFKTGDILYRRDGRYYFVGRQKDLIKVKGYSVSPEEIEAVLLQHPLVADCAVVGVTVSEEKHAPRAYVVRKDTTLHSLDVYNWSQARLADYKALGGGVIFVDSVPRTASSKVQRFKLLEMPLSKEEGAC